MSHYIPAHTHLKDTVTLLFVVSHGRTTDEDGHQHHLHQQDALQSFSSAAETTVTMGGAGVEGSEFWVRALSRAPETVSHYHI